MTTRSRLLLSRIFLLFLSGCSMTVDEVASNVILPEQRVVGVRTPEQLPPAVIPDIPAPRTVTQPREGTPEWRLSLDEAIRIGLENARVVRVLAGISATSSGQTIYDAAITQTTIDQALSRFDAVLAQTTL